ncbi:MAG: STAS domain-containing protein [Oligoflexia bacterium]|nr:STAS domain-containing protein [Oligoflexia bacterium]
MKTRLRKDRDIYFFDLEGNLDMSGVDHLQSFCSNKNLKKRKIVFNLKFLFFVGSTGVGVFSKTLDFVKQNNNLKICCASSEFEKIFTNEGLDSLLFPSEEEAVLSFSNNQEIQTERDGLSFIQSEYPLKHEGEG